MNWYLLAFFLIPLVLLGAKEAGRIKSPTWLIFGFCVLSGWLLISLALWAYQTELDRLVLSQPKPPPELLKLWEHDGATSVFTLILGWAYAALDFLVALGIVKGVAIVYRRLRN